MKIINKHKTLLKLNNLFMINKMILIYLDLELMINLIIKKLNFGENDILIFNLLNNNKINNCLI